MNVERHFDIEIPDDQASPLGTLGMLHRWVVAELRQLDRPNVYPAPLFDKLHEHICKHLGVKPSKLSKIEISPNGLGLHWPLLDADLYVPGLIEGTFGSGRWMQQIGKLGGSTRSAAKAKTSRENGKRGGRPKAKVAA